MKQKIAAPLPAALACGMLLDGNRALFLVKKDEKGNETLSLPCTLIYAGENPAGAAVGDAVHAGKALGKLAVLRAEDVDAEEARLADRIVGGVVPHQYRPAVEKGIVEAMAEGVLAGYPVVDIRVSLVDGSYHTVDSSEMAFKIAGSLGFKKGVLECQPTLLEPIVNMNIEIPDEYMGDVIGDLNSRRGKVLGMDSAGHHQIIKGQVPFAETLKYAPDLRSMTSGRGPFP